MAQSRFDIIVKRAYWTSRLIAVLITIHVFNFTLDWKLTEFFYLPSKISPWGSYRIITSSLVHGSVWHLIGNSIGILILGLILEPRLPIRHYFILVISSVVIRGILFLACYNCNMVVPLLGAGFIRDVFAGGLIACWLKFMADFNKLEKIYTYIILFFLGLHILAAVILIVTEKTNELSAIYYVSWLMNIYGFVYVLILGDFFRLEINKSDEPLQKWFFVPPENK